MWWQRSERFEDGRARISADTYLCRRRRRDRGNNSAQRSRCVGHLDLLDERWTVIHGAQEHPRAAGLRLRRLWGEDRRDAPADGIQAKRPAAGAFTSGRVAPGKDLLPAGVALARGGPPVDLDKQQVSPRRQIANN